jgi:hypothetical protein
MAERDVMRSASEPYPYRIKSVSELPQRIGESRAVYALDPDIPRISIYCEQASHKGNPWFVASFTRTDTANGPNWAESAHYPTGDGYCFAIRSTTHQMVGTERAIDPRDLDPMDPSYWDAMAEATRKQYGPDFRVRYPLECPLCDLRHVARSDSMQKPLEKLFAGGLLEVTLSSVAARLA